MSASPLYGERPSMQGSFRRSFTLPARQLSVHEKAGLDKTDANADVLYSHPSARVISFSPPKESIKSTSKAEIPADTDYPIDTVETLPWRSRTESLIATGILIIEKVRGSTNFLKCQDVMHAILRNSQCWCVDGESKFVLRVRKFQYYRIELPSTSEEDKAKVEELKKVLPTVLRFERTPCPFIRAFTVDLPEDAITPRRKGPWTRRDSSQSNVPDTEMPTMSRRKPERSWSARTPPTSYPKNVASSAVEGERGRTGGPAGIHRRASLFEAYRNSSPASLGLSEDGTDSDHLGSEHDSEIENMTDRSETSSPHKHLDRPKRKERVMSEVSTNSTERHLAAEVTSEIESGTKSQDLSKSAIPTTDSQNQGRANNNENATAINVNENQIMAGPTLKNGNSSSAGVETEAATTTQNLDSESETVERSIPTDDSQLLVHSPGMETLEKALEPTGISNDGTSDTALRHEGAHNDPSSDVSETTENVIGAKQGVSEPEAHETISIDNVTANLKPVGEFRQLEAQEGAFDGLAVTSRLALQSESGLRTEAHMPPSVRNETHTDPHKPVASSESDEKSKSVASTTSDVSSEEAEPRAEPREESTLEQISSQTGPSNPAEGMIVIPVTDPETGAEWNSEDSAKHSIPEQQDGSESAIIDRKTPELLPLKVSDISGAEENLSEGELSPVSSVDSFHTIASTMHRPSSGDESDAENTPIARRRALFPNAVSRHKREIFEITITASSGSEPSSPEHNRSLIQESEQDRTPSLSRFSTSNGSYPENLASLSASHEQNSVRQRFKARQRSFSPLPPASTIFTGNQIRHDSGRGHMTKAILQKVVVKPIEVAIMVVHILARIANGATVSDLLSGELFRTPENQGRISGFADHLNDGKSGSETEDDYGVPIRGRRRSSEMRMAMAIDDEIDDQLGDVD